MFANANGIPIELHTHCTTGLGPLCCLEAVKLGIKIVNTALPPLADGSSNPSLFNVARNLRALGYRTLIDEEILKPVSEHFTQIAKREGFPIGEPVEYDYSQYQHQVPWEDLMRFSDVVNSASGGYGSTRQYGYDRRSAAPQVGGPSPWAQAISGGISGAYVGSQIANAWGGGSGYSPSGGVLAGYSGPVGGQPGAYPTG